MSQEKKSTVLFELFGGDRKEGEGTRVRVVES